MKKTCLLVALLATCLHANQQSIATAQQATDTNNLKIELAKESADLSFEVHNPVRQYSKLKCLTLVIGSNDLIDKVAQIVKFDLEFSDQLDIDMKRSEKQ